MGVSDSTTTLDEAPEWCRRGERRSSPVTYWKVDNGIRLTGMPSFRHILSNTEMWQVSLLLSQADQQQPPAVANTFMGSQQERTQH